VKTHPDYKSYIESLNYRNDEIFIATEALDCNRVRDVLRKMFRTDGSLNKILNLCQDELKILEHSNTLDITEVSERLIEHFHNPNSYEYLIFKDTYQKVNVDFLNSKDLLLDIDPPCPQLNALRKYQMDKQPSAA
jgi:hypothetical protein